MAIFGSFRQPNRLRSWERIRGKIRFHALQRYNNCNNTVQQQQQRKAIICLVPMEGVEAKLMAFVILRKRAL